MIPYKLDVMMERRPLMNFGLIAVTTVISIIGFIADFNESTAMLAFHQWHGESFRLYQLLTSIFIHGGILHLLGNMMALFVFGNAINAKLGQLKYLALYLSAGIVANIISRMFGPASVEIYGFTHEIHSVGASGAIMGVIGAVLILYPRNNVSILWIFFFLFYKIFEISVGWLIVFYVVMDLLGSMGGSGGTDYMAHVGGAFFGILSIGWLVWKGKLESSDNEENLFQVLGWKPKAPEGIYYVESVFANRKTIHNKALNMPDPEPAAKPVLKSYLVHGSDRSSGFKTSFEVKAKDMETAYALAEKEDIIPERIVEVL